jgi:hypothetical protein
MLDIRLARRSNKPARANVYRKYKNKQSPKWVGSFQIFAEDKNEILTLTSLLDETEVLQLQNWIAEVRFFKETMGVEPDELNKTTLLEPAKLSTAVFKLYLEAKKLDIQFIPHKIMREALFKKAKQVQSRVNALNKTDLQLFDESWLKTAHQEQAEKDDLEAKILFKTLVALPQSLGKTCDELEIASALYRHKPAKIPPAQLREWAGDMPKRHAGKKIKKWAFALAIDVLEQHNINSTTLLSPNKLARYWVLPKKESLTLDQAIRQFIKKFSVEKKHHKAVKAEITRLYQY